MEILGATVLITGATGAIGAATVREFASEGANIVLTSRSEDKLNELASSIGTHRALAVCADITNSLEVESAVKKGYQKFGSIDILVNNAATGLVSNIMNITDEDFRRIIEINLLGPLYTVQKAVPFMTKNGGGIIINVSSMITRIASKGSGGYRATKLALDGLTDAMRVELREQNIKVVLIYPGLTKSDFYKNSLGSKKTNAPDGKKFNYTPEQVAKRIVYAARKEKRMVFMNLRGQIGAIASLIFPGLLEHILHIKKKYF